MNVGDDLRPSLESLGDRRFRGDLCEPLQLLPGERRGKMNLPLDAVRFTLLVMIELDPDGAQLPALPLRVHAQRDRGAGPQRGEQKSVRGGSGVGAAVRMRLIGGELVSSGTDSLRVARGALDDHMGDARHAPAVSQPMRADKPHRPPPWEISERLCKIRAWTSRDSAAPTSIS